jgi:molecular chaperone DnaJ
MLIKDYYNILQVPPTASEAVIKKAFRRLALRYHPDKNAGNAVAEAYFREIQEAYAVLTDKAQREEYNYKRWYNRSIGKNFSEKALTPAAILADCKKLNDYLAMVNIFQLDYSSLNQHIHSLVSNEAITLLATYNDLPVNRDIAGELLKSARLLPFAYVEAIAERLYKIPGVDEQMKIKISDFVKAQQLRDRWKKYQLPVVVIVTVLLCWFIFWLTRQ